MLRSRNFLIVTIEFIILFILVSIAMTTQLLMQHNCYGCNRFDWIVDSMKYSVFFSFGFFMLSGLILSYLVVNFLTIERLAIAFRAALNFVLLLTHLCIFAYFFGNNFPTKAELVIVVLCSLASVCLSTFGTRLLSLHTHFPK